MAIFAVAVIALGIALKSPASRAQGQSQVALQTAGDTQSVPTRSTVAAASAAGSAPAVVASNLGVRTMAVAQPLGEPSPASALSAASPAELYFSSVDQTDRIFSFVVRATASALKPASSKSFLASPVVGTGAVGSVGDGGAASSAELDLKLGDFTMRSAVATGPDGTLYIADTGNATIRTVAGPASSEPGIIRSLVGRWAPRQNVELAEPIGIALDRAGNLYIADHGMNAILVLNGPASPKAGQLETLAHMVSPASVAVSPDGRTVFASSPDSGAVVAINTQTRALRNAAASPAPLFAAALQNPANARIIPTGLAVDGGGNLFIAYSSSGAAYDQILRLDAISSQLTVAARGLSEPGDISFDAQGDLFVANQGLRQVLKFKSMGVPATGVTLTPPASCTGAATVFCDQVIGGTSPTQPFELTNNTAAAISGVAASFTAGNTTDFKIVNSSCAASLAQNASCNFNVAFAPTANATTACAAGSASNTRCATFSVNYNGATAPLTTLVNGVADDFQVECMTTSTFTCPPPSNGAPYQITIAQGQAATFQLQVVPDSTFSGTVMLICPTGLPVGPTGTTGSPTTCGLAAGTTVTTPLVNTLALPVTAGTAAPFTLTFQTTTTAGTQLPPTPTSPSSQRTRRSVAFVPAGHDDDSNNSSDSAPVLAATVLSIVFLISLGGVIPITPQLRRPSRRVAGLLALLSLLAMAPLMTGCHHYSSSTATIPFTPTGTYNLTVQGSAQNAGRGFTVTLVVD
ncbi:MAG: NHL repeat-containing protein [Candidatus Acidiferrales bacterium]